MRRLAIAISCILTAGISAAQAAEPSEAALSVLRQLTLSERRGMPWPIPRLICAPRRRPG